MQISNVNSKKNLPSSNKERQQDRMCVWTAECGWRRELCSLYKDRCRKLKGEKNGNKQKWMPGSSIAKPKSSRSLKYKIVYLRHSLHFSVLDASLLRVKLNTYHLTLLFLEPTEYFKIVASLSVRRGLCPGVFGRDAAKTRFFFSSPCNSDKINSADILLTAQ